MATDYTEKKIDTDQKKEIRILIRGYPAFPRHPWRKHMATDYTERRIDTDQKKKYAFRSVVIRLFRVIRGESNWPQITLKEGSTRIRKKRYAF